MGKRSKVLGKAHSMRIGGVTIAYNEAPLVEGCIKTMAPFVDEHLWIVSEKPYFNRERFESDNTTELAEEYGATVIEGIWEKEHEQRNVGVKYFADKDWILWADADMWGTRAYWEELLRHLEVAPPDTEAIVTRQYTLWKEPKYHIVNDDFKPVVATRPSVRFSEIGCVNKVLRVYDNRMHHFVWSKPKDIYKKLMTFSHAKDTDWETWYNEVFVNWNGGDTTTPNCEYPLHIEEIDVPEEFGEFL